MAHLQGVSVWVFLTLLSSTDSMENCTSNADFTFLVNLTQIPGQRTDKSAGSLEPLYNFARLFLEAVQPNKFPLGKYHSLSYCFRLRWKVSISTIYCSCSAVFTQLSVFSEIMLNSVELIYKKNK